MASNPTGPNINGSVHQLVQDALGQLASVKDELVLNFSRVRRIDPPTLRELDRLASAAQDSSVKVALQGVNSDVYKALKLSALAERFSFR